MNKNRRRGVGSVLVALGGVLVACSVDTSDVTFVPDRRLDIGNNDAGAPDVDAGGALNRGGVANIGGIANVAGVLNKAGSSGKAGAGTGGVVGVAGAPIGGSGMTAGAGGMPAMGCPMAMGDARQLLIDDFTDGDAGLEKLAGRNGGWYVINDGKGTQMPPNDPSRPPRPEAPGWDGTGLALHTAGSGFTIWGAGYGMAFLSGPNMSACPYDTTPHMGIRFYAKGKIGGMDTMLHIHVATQEVADREHGGTCDATKERCFDNFSMTFGPLSDVWTQYSVPYTRLAQEGWGTPKPFNKSHLMNLEFTTGVDANFDFWLDRVEFF